MEEGRAAVRCELLDYYLCCTNSAQAWLVQSQPELERRFVDILCTRLPSIPVNWNFDFELRLDAEAKSVVRLQ